MTGSGPLDDWIRALLTKGSISEKREENQRKPAMRGPFSVDTPVTREMTENSGFRGLQELSESGWFNEGFGQLFQEKVTRKRQLLTWIHKETPMFYHVFQEIPAMTLGNLSLFYPKST